MNNVVRYAIEHYDQHGFLKAPKWLWLGWFFLARAWIVFVVAGASRESGSEILTIVYPNQTGLYLGLLMGLPTIALMWLYGLRSPERTWLTRVLYYGRPLTLVIAVAQWLQWAYQVYLHHGAFSWTPGGIGLLLTWLIIYLVNSRSVKDCFQLGVENESTKAST